MTDLKRLIRDVPDFPKKGIVFKDITPLLRDSQGLSSTVTALSEYGRSRGAQVVAGIESRGFIVGAAVACQMGAGFVPLRKKGKLPWDKAGKSYDLEYGTDTIEVHKDAIDQGQRVLLVDDLLATGGTAAAAVALVEMMGGRIAGIGFIIELGFLKGRAKLKGHDILALIRYD